MGFNSGFKGLKQYLPSNFQDLMMMMLSLLLSNHLMRMAKLTVKGKHMTNLFFTYSLLSVYQSSGYDVNTVQSKEG